MIVVGIICIIGVLSFILALRSMKDFDSTHEMMSLLHMEKMRGTIVFFKDKIEHYSSSSS